MGNSGLMYIILGAIIMAGGYFLKGQFTDWGMYPLYIGVETVGLGVFLFGVFAIIKGRRAGASPEEKQNLTYEVILKTLSRMTYADTNIEKVEVDAVKGIYKKCTGQSVTDADIRVAARGDLHEDRAFKKYLGQSQSHISKEDKCLIMQCLADVIKADGKVSPGEVAFFDEVGQALKLTPADIANFKN